MTAQERPARTARWLVPVLVAVAVAALAFAVGRFSTFGASAPVAPTTDSAEAGFARDMQMHHAQAVEMAMELYRKTGDDELRAIAYDIATAQSAQRGEMYDWLVQWGLPQAGGPAMAWMAGGDEGHGHSDGSGEPMTDARMREAMGMATDEQLARLRAAEGRDAECLFTELMIRHHEGAIPMVDAVLELGSEPRVLAVAQRMKEAQTAEIDALRSVQARLSCASGPVQ